MKTYSLKWWLISLYYIVIIIPIAILLLLWSMSGKVLIFLGGYLPSHIKSVPLWAVRVGNFFKKLVPDD